MLLHDRGPAEASNSVRCSGHHSGAYLHRWVRWSSGVEPSWAFAVFVGGPQGRAAPIGFEGGPLVSEIHNLAPLAAELQGAQWALAWLVRSEFASPGREYRLRVYIDDSEALRVAQ
eukprot:1912393-Pyramimonas_sp.AAC.1